MPAFGHACADIHAGLLFRVEVDIEVIGLEYLKSEVFVLDLVAAEVLRRGRFARR